MNITSLLMPWDKTAVTKPQQSPAVALTSAVSTRFGDYVQATICIVSCTLMAHMMVGFFGINNLMMVYLLGVVWVAATKGRGPSIAASVLSVAAFDFLFVPPVLSLTVHDSQYVLTLAVMLTVALLISTMSTRLRLQMEQTAQLSKEAEVERLRSTLLSSISHDLRTPLATITGAASGLLQHSSHSLSEDDRALAKAIYEEAQRLERFVGNLLNITRLESGEVVIHKEWQPIEEVIGSALNRLEERLSGCNVTTKVPGDLLAPIDAVLIEQVLLNVLDNAVAHAGEHCHITIAAEEADNALRVSVTDDGPGIPPQARDRVFDKFFRTDRSSSRQGTGLGLAICRAVVEAHGGTIKVEDVIPHGTKISFIIPRDGTPPEASE